MSQRVLTLFAIAAALVFMAIPSSARSNPGTLSATIDLDSTTSINKTTIAPGEYKVVVDGTQAKFEKDGKVVAEVPCTLKTLSNKAAQTEFVVEHDHLMEIQISGKTEAIEFSSDQNTGD